MAYACACFSQKLQLFIIEVDTVSIPYIVSYPAQFLHVCKRADAFTLKHIVLLILGLAQMSVKSHALFTCEYSTLAEQILRNGER